MRTQHLFERYMVKLVEAEPIVATGNNKQEVKRIIKELRALAKVNGKVTVSVDVGKFSIDKLMHIVEESRLGMEEYRLCLIHIEHPALEGEFVFKESFYENTHYGSGTTLSNLLKEDEDYMANYGRWVQSIVKQKHQEIESINSKFENIIKDKKNVEQVVSGRSDKFPAKSRKVELNHLVDISFNPFRKLFSPELSMNASPSFQRNLVWTTDMKVNFIDSILKGIPVGVFYENDNIMDLTLGEGYGLILWDGKQRLHAIYSFLNDEFKVQYKGQELYYSQMRSIFNDALRQTLVTVMTTEFETLDEIVEAYVMINMKQVKHTDEDLEKAKATLLQKRPTLYHI